MRLDFHTYGLCPSAKAAKRHRPVGLPSMWDFRKVEGTLFWGPSNGTWGSQPQNLVGRLFGPYKGFLLLFQGTS